MARRLPSLNALRAFEAAARHESFTKAAAELFVTHAAISRHVRDLETWLNVKLFRRLGRRVVLSEVGRRYSRRLTPLFDELAAATSEALVPEAVGALTITAETAFTIRWLVPRLGGFSKAHPDIDLILDPSDELTNFRVAPAEIGVRFGSDDSDAWDDVDIELLCDLMTFPVCSPDLLNGGEELEVEALRRFPLLHEETRAWWSLWLESAGLAAFDHARGPLLRDTHLALEAAAAGQGFALGDSLLAADDLARGRLIKPFEVEVPCGAYYLVRPKRLVASPQAEAFATWLRAEMAVFLGVPAKQLATG